MEEYYYFVVRLGLATSILELHIRGDTLTLRERIVLGIDRAETPFPPLRGVCLREGKAAFLFDGEVITVTDVMGIFPSLRAAILCWQSNSIPDDSRWRLVTDAMRGTIRKRKHPRIV